MTGYFPTELPTSTLLLYSIPTALFAYIFSLSIYRLYFHPLSRFPGPTLPALTLWYEFYYDVVLRGKFCFEIIRMHQRHGPIVRINPNELHVADPDFYDVVYVGAATRKTDKYPWSARMFGNPGSMLSTVSHDLHRMRRQPLNPFFSRASVTKLEPTIKRKISRMCERMEAVQKTGEPIRLDLAYTALTADIITEYSFGRAYDFLEREDLGIAWTHMQEGGLEFSLLQKQLGWVMPLLGSLPPWLVEKMDPNMREHSKAQASVEQDIRGVMAEQETSSEKKSKDGGRTIFHALLNSDIPDSDKSVQRLADEAQTIVAAGAHTTAHFLRTVTYHILANQSVLTRLLDELKAAMPDPNTIPSSQELEKLPYFTAVVNESYRISYGITSRLTRVSPNQPLQFRDWTIPAGTPVSMSTMIQHSEPSLFPDPDKFNPERFLHGGERLTKYLVNFSRGTRGCLGLNLARAEIYLTLAAVFRQFGTRMELFETDRSDVDVCHDFFSPHPKLDSKGMRVVVK